MSIPKWPINPVANFEKIATPGTAIAYLIDDKDQNSLYLLNIGTNEQAPGIRDNQRYARSEFALCALKNSIYAVPYHLIKKIAMVFTAYHFFDSKASCSDRAIAWLKDIARIIILPFAWLLLITTALFAAIYPCAGLRNTVATLQSALLENDTYEKFRAMTLDEVKTFAKNNTIPEPLDPSTLTNSPSQSSSSSTTISDPVETPNPDSTTTVLSSEAPPMENPDDIPPPPPLSSTPLAAPTNKPVSSPTKSPSSRPSPTANTGSKPALDAETLKNQLSALKKPTSTNSNKGTNLLSELTGAVGGKKLKPSSPPPKPAQQPATTPPAGKHLLKPTKPVAQKRSP